MISQKGTKQTKFHVFDAVVLPRLFSVVTLDYNSRGSAVSNLVDFLIEVQKLVKLPHLATRSMETGPT